MHNNSIGGRPATSREREGAVLIAAMLTAMVRNDSHSSADVKALAFDLAELFTVGNEIVSLTLQTTASIIKSLCESAEVNVEPVQAMQFFLDHIRNKPTEEELG